ncbi:TPA: hypothetical protein ACFP4A_002065 [Neisseria subflava]
MCNQGKKGEMRVTGLISDMGQVDGSVVDFERYSTTNTADNGIDVCLHHTQDHFREMVEISGGNRSEFSNPSKYTSSKMSTRIDVKTYSGKITKPVMDKFVSDIPKHPRINGHMMMGGEGLTKGAEKSLQDARNNYPNNMIAYIPESGLQKLSKAIKHQLEHKDDDKK